MAKHNRKDSFPAVFFLLSLKRLVSVARGESKDIKSLPFTITQYLRSKRNPGCLFQLSFFSITCL